MDKGQTEAHIKNTAKTIFFVKGRLHAKTQEIADEAKVNRALLHYYFRSREKLFEEVLKDAFKEAHEEFFRIISGNAPFEKKIEDIVAHILERTIRYPYLETFIVSEMMDNPEKIWMMQKPEVPSEFRDRFKNEMQEYIDTNELPHKTPQHLIANLFALCTYPSVVKPLLMNIFQYSEEDFNRFMQERKVIITKLLLGKK